MANLWECVKSIVYIMKKKRQNEKKEKKEETKHIKHKETKSSGHKRTFFYHA